MADIICRWRNGTPQTVVELVNSMPHKVMPSSDFRNYMTQHWNGDFFRTPYQLACQLGLYCEAEDGMFYPRFDHDITESEALDYLEFWITRYYVPNPYTGKDGFKDLKCPTYVLKSLYDYVVAHPDCNYSEAYKAVFHEAAKNNDDIVRNYINNYSKVLTFSKNGRLNTTSYNASKIFKFMDKNDKKGFFDSFSKPKQVSLMDKYLEAGIDDRAQMFYDYLIGQDKSESTANQYAFLHPKKDVVLDIVKKRAGADSLFDVIVTTTINSIFQEVNETEANKKQNNAFSATISNYRKFIDYLEETTTDDLEPNDKPSPSTRIPNEDDGTIIEPDENSRYWIYAPGEGASMWQLCQDKGIMVLGWGDIGDYSQYTSQEKLIADMQATYNLYEKNFMNSSLAVWQFYKDMKPGDVIFVKQGRSKILGRGVVQGGYQYDEELNEEFRSFRKVNWTDIGKWDAPFNLAVKTLTRIGVTENDKLLIKQLNDLFITEEKPVLEQVPFSIDKMIEYIDETGLIYSPSLIKRFAFSLLTKPFVILSGLAGSGKTQLAITFAKALVENRKSQLCTVSVGADWTNREPLLGFPNALQSAQYVRPESRVLDLLIEANKPENSDKPYFLILDEMNMSYVERYFADFLSAMESKEAIPLWNGCTDLDEDDEEWDDTPTSIKLPSNLFIIGTINVDETTYMFSPKVLDRANVIEFKISADEMSSFLENMKDVHPDNIISKAANMSASFVDIASKNDLEKDAAAVVTLKKFFQELKNVNAEFGYRSATEIFRFICQAKNNDSKDEKSKMSPDEILDAAIVQKLLPKLHGSRKKLDPVLKQLWRLCFDGAESELPITDENAKKAKFKESADKIWRMYESAIANGFTSFAEA